MRTNKYFQSFLFSITPLVAATLLSGCGTTNPEGSSPHVNSVTAGSFAKKYQATDGRKIEIGPSTADNGGWKFRDPHLDKCWIASGFDFKGYDTVYIAPTLSTAKFHDDEKEPHQLAKENLVIELARLLAKRGVVVNVVTRESDIPAGAHALKLENTIVKYSKGGGGARFFAGLYGAGQPVLQVQGKMTDGDKVIFSFEAQRSGVSAGSRLSGGFLTDEEIQSADIHSMVLDLTDFMAAIAGKYQPID